MVTDFLKGVQSQTTRAVDIETDGNGVAEVNVSDLVSVDSAEDVIASLLDVPAGTNEAVNVYVSGVGEDVGDEVGSNTVELTVVDDSAEPVETGEGDDDEPISVGLVAVGF